MRLEFTPNRPPCRDCNQSKHNLRIRLQVGLVSYYKSRETSFEAPHRNWLTTMDPRMWLTRSDLLGAAVVGAAVVLP